MSFVVVDTDVASAILKAQLPDSLRANFAGERLAVTFVTVGELTQWTYLHRWGAQRRAGLHTFFASLVVLHSSARPPGVLRGQRCASVRVSCLVSAAAQRPVGR